MNEGELFESEYVLEAIIEKIQKEYEIKKENLINSMFKVKSKEERAEIKQKLKDLDYNCDKEIKELKKNNLEKNKEVQEDIITDLSTRTIINNENDNDIYKYHLNLIDNIKEMYEKHFKKILNPENVNILKDEELKENSFKVINSKEKDINPSKNKDNVTESELESHVSSYKFLKEMNGCYDREYPEECKLPKFSSKKDINDEVFKKVKGFYEYSDKDAINNEYCKRMKSKEVDENIYEDDINDVFSGWEKGLSESNNKEANNNEHFREIKTKEVNEYNNEDSISDKYCKKNQEKECNEHNKEDIINGEDSKKAKEIDENYIKKIIYDESDLLKKRLADFYELIFNDHYQFDKKNDDIFIVSNALFCDFMDILKEYFSVKNEEGLYILKDLWTVLFNFQKETVHWFYILYKKNEGCILADEMGLGKTLQVICFLSAMFISKKISLILLIIPSTLINQWIEEFKKFFPFVRILVIHKSAGSNFEILINQIKKLKTIVIVTYEGFKKYQKKFSKIDFDYFILDEGHKIKNRNTEITKSLSLFEFTRKIIITGTPLQNNLDELYTLINFVCPGKLGSYLDFQIEYVDPIKKGGFKNASDYEIRKAYKMSLFLRNIIDPYIKRRLKSQIKHQLPSKTDKIVFCNLTKEQEYLYKKELDSEHIYKVLIGKLNCMSGLISLRKICNHPILHYKKRNSLIDIVQSSSKMIKIDLYLKKWFIEGHKVLIFSQMLGMLDILEEYLQRSNYKYVRIDGKTKLSKRNSNIENFQIKSDVFIFLLTTKVGGYGLNLTQASRIILYDPDWNPSVDAQAKERAYRYGQKKDVEIYRFITSGTIEEKILKKQIYKNFLTQKILHNPKLNKLFEKIDINHLFTYERNENKEERIEDNEYDNEEKIENENKEENLEFNFKTIDANLKKRMEKFKNKEILDENELIEFIGLREKK